MNITSLDSVFMINSEGVQDFILNPSEYSALSITVTKDCDTVIATDVITVPENAVWEVELASNAGSYIKQVKIINTRNGAIISLPLINVLVDGNNLALLDIVFISVNAYFTNSVLTFNGTTKYGVDSSVPNKVILQFQNFPTDFALYSIEVLTTGNVNSVLSRSARQVANSVVQDKLSFINYNNLMIHKTPQMFDEGVYSFDINITDRYGNIINNTGCHYVDNDLKCKIYDLMGCFEDNVELFVAYKLLEEYQNCDNCNCSDLCQHYNYVINLLENICKDCGCE